MLLILCASLSVAPVWADQDVSSGPETQASPQAQSQPTGQPTDSSNLPQSSTIPPNVNLNNIGDGIAIPPELLQSLLQSAGPAKTLAPPKMSLRTRLLLVIATLVTIMVGVLFCQILASKLVHENHQTSIFLIFGLFSAMGALCLACALVGNLRLHLAAVLCTLASGFCLGAIGIGPLPWFRTWLLVEVAKTNDQKDVRHHQ
ncbi:MAG: hypothetical protein JW936_11625 [Sedimentisphaerales bacterium]|nr:hypothetical protein [Sedimentisphaerales bacterium]